VELFGTFLLAIVSLNMAKEKVPSFLNEKNMLTILLTKKQVCDDVSHK
jgi:hypothetical protein